MDVACDALRVWLADRSGIELDGDVALDLGHDGAESAVFKGKVVGLRPAVEGLELWALGGLRELLTLHVAAAYENQSAGAIAHKPSLLQDYERGRPMEIDALLVAPVQFARAAGVPAPTLEAIAALVVFKACAKGLYSRAAD